MLCKRHCVLILVIPLYLTFFVSFLEYVPLLDTFEHKPMVLDFFRGNPI